MECSTTASIACRAPASREEPKLTPGSKQSVIVARGQEQGSATIGLLAAGLAAILLGVTAAMLGSVVVAKRRAAAAADLGALAGARLAASGSESACHRAAQIASANGARMVDCHVSDLEVSVDVEVPVAWGIHVAAARARAGPTGSAPETEPTENSSPATANAGVRRSP